MGIGFCDKTANIPYIDIFILNENFKKLHRHLFILYTTSQELTAFQVIYFYSILESKIRQPNLSHEIIPNKLSLTRK